jgi:hypothetical protein
MENERIIFEIIGPGCRFCARLHELTAEVVAESRLDAEIRKVTELKQVIRHIPFTPVLRLDGEVIHRGKFLPSKDKLADMITRRIRS